jgi:NTP pyrophosphatase (non-canonical NTP hydrolase)
MKKGKALSFNEYQRKARETAIYPNIGKNYVYPTLGISGEAGEIAEKVKKIQRDKEGIIGEEERKELVKEIGDVLWYLANFAEELDITLDEAAKQNIQKLSSRQKRGKLRGSGDNR